MANQRVQQLAREHGDLLMPHLWTGITASARRRYRHIGQQPAQCAGTLRQFIDAGCHSFCLSGYLHDEKRNALAADPPDSGREPIAAG